MRRRSQAERIERASRPSSWDGRTLEDELRQLREAVRELGREILRAVSIGRR